MNTTIKDYRPETRDLIRALRAAGVAILGGNNGEDDFTDNGVENDLITNLTACDEAHLFVSVNNSNAKSNGPRKWLFLVFGNSPGELVCDYVCDETLDRVVDAHYEKWNALEQPTTTI